MCLDGYMCVHDVGQGLGKQDAAVAGRVKQCFGLALSPQGNSVAFGRQAEAQGLRCRI